MPSSSPASLLGLALLAFVLVAATGFGLMRRRVDGRVRAAGPAAQAPALGAQLGSQLGAQVLAELGEEPGTRATLLQFSSAFCQPCRATRRMLADVAGMVEGVRHVEVDAESHLELVRRLDITRTPTVLVIDPAGEVARRAVGLPRKTEVLAAVADLGGSEPRPHR